MTGYTYELGRVINGVQLVDVRGPWQFDENDFVGSIAQEPIPQTPALIDGQIVDAPPDVRDVLEAEQRAADLAANGERYVLENQYILLCDALRGILGQTPDKTPISEAAFPVMLLGLKKASEPTYNTIRDAFALVTGKLVTYNLKWMESVCWHPEPELTEASNAIMGLVQ